MEQCLYAVMLASANDVCLQIAEHIGGTVDGFVEMMNERAESLGCTNTVFTNPTGLPDDAQHTTAHDMALIMQAALENETFRTILSAQSYTIPATNVSGGERALTNPFEMLNSQDASYYADCIGGKKGFTNASGETLVCAAERDDMTLICVLLQGTSSATPSEAGTLLDYGFDNFSLLDIGKDDFDVQSGGIILAPNGTTADSFTTEDTETEDGMISRTYLYQDVAVGTSICSKDTDESSAAFAENESNLQAAKDYSVDQSLLPYVIIGGVGGVLFLILLFLFIRTLKA
jgi:D-alanyl-D-alanine carboxypeptidase